MGGRKGVLNKFIDYNISGGGYIRGRIGPYNISEFDIFIVISDEDHDDNYKFRSKMVQLFFHILLWWYHLFCKNWWIRCM